MTGCVASSPFAGGYSRSASPVIGAGLPLRKSDLSHRDRKTPPDSDFRKRRLPIRIGTSTEGATAVEHAFANKDHRWTIAAFVERHAIVEERSRSSACDLMKPRT